MSNAMAIQPSFCREIGFDTNRLEQVILQFGDAFGIRIEWDWGTALVTGACVVAGGLVGSYAGSRLGAVVGAGLGGAAGFSACALVSLRDLWASVKDQLQELFFIVFNYLRLLDAVDYAHAVEILMACSQSRYQLACAIIDFIAGKLGTKVISVLNGAA